MSRNDSSTGKDSHYARLRRAHRERTRAADSFGKEHPGALRVQIYGLHAVGAALANPRRRIHALHVTRNAAQRLKVDDSSSLPFPVEMVEPRALDRMLGVDAVHQGACLEADPLQPRSLAALGDTSLVLLLDQVTDPHNVGAILRSAVAFGAGALITTSRHSPKESGVLAKSASGALEHIDLIEVRNLANALEELSAAGFATVGLDSQGPLRLEEIGTLPKIALVLGSEGKGLRERTRQTVRHLARLDMPGPIRSLNVSNAAALSLYIARSQLLQPTRG